MNNMIDFFRPPDDTPHPMRRWCYGVSVSLTAGVIVAIWAMSPKGFATEGKVRDQIKLEVTAQIKPVLEEQQKQTAAQLKTDAKVDRLSSLLIEQLATAKAAEIRAVTSKRCKVPGFIERDELLREIERLQKEHIAIVGVKYDAPSCSEL